MKDTNHATKPVGIGSNEVLKNKLARDIKDLDKGKVSTGEFRKQWGLHFDSNMHMSVCTCYGLCPFRSVS